MTLATTITFDPTRGHVAVQADKAAPAEVILTDMGDGTLKLWAFSSVELIPDVARALAEALQTWADLRAERTPA